MLSFRNSLSCNLARSPYETVTFRGPMGGYTNSWVHFRASFSVLSSSLAYGFCVGRRAEGGCTLKSDFENILPDRRMEDDSSTIALPFRTSSSCFSCRVAGGVEIGIGLLSCPIDLRRLSTSFGDLRRADCGTGEGTLT